MKTKALLSLAILIALGISATAVVCNKQVKDVEDCDTKRCGTREPEIANGCNRREFVGPISHIILESGPYYIGNTYPIATTCISRTYLQAWDEDEQAFYCTDNQFGQPTLAYSFCDDFDYDSNCTPPGGS